MFYAGDELYGDEITSGPYDPRDDAEPHPDDDDFDAERQAIEDEYDRDARMSGECGS